jgi:hypothetical protein
LTENAPSILDLSTFNFDEFVQFFFAREVLPDEQQFDYFYRSPSGKQYDGAEASSPRTVVGYLTRLFSEFGLIAPRYSMAQVDQGVWGIFGERLHLHDFLWDERIPLPERVACIRSMYSVYADFVAKSPAGQVARGFFMWWDLILHWFWCQWGPEGRMTRSGDLSSLSADSRVLLDAMFDTLKRTLEIDNSGVRSCALHGLGHLHHPGVRDLVQKYIDDHRSDYDAEGLRWMEQCRNGAVM